MHNEPESPEAGTPATGPQAPLPQQASRAGDDRAAEPQASDAVSQRVQAAAGGLAALLTAAEVAQQQRVRAAQERGAPRWTDVFTTQFTEFSNRPR